MNISCAVCPNGMQCTAVLSGVGKETANNLKLGTKQVPWGDGPLTHSVSASGLLDWSWALAVCVTLRTHVDSSISAWGHRPPHSADNPQGANLVYWPRFPLLCSDKLKDLPNICILYIHTWRKCRSTFTAKDHESIKLQKVRLLGSKIKGTCNERKLQMLTLKNPSFLIASGRRIVLVINPEQSCS